VQDDVLRAVEDDKLEDMNESMTKLMMRLAPGLVDCEAMSALFGIVASRLAVSLEARGAASDTDRSGLSLLLVSCEGFVCL
jgi:hypothetical protein